MKQRLEAEMQVENIDYQFNIIGVILFSTLGSLPGFCLALFSLSDDVVFSGAMFSVLGLFGGVVISMLGGYFAFVFWCYLEDVFNTKKGLPKAFSKNTDVAINESGIYIHGLGYCNWQDVLAIEGVPDTDEQLVIYTVTLGKLMLHHNIAKLVTIINHYTNDLAEINAIAAQNQQDVYRFKAVIFNWSAFFTCIIVGYLGASAALLALLFLKPSAGFITPLVTSLFLGPSLAHLIWGTSFKKNISNMAGKRTKGFVLSKNSLISHDKTIDVDLSNAYITFHHKAGIGYALDFMRIKPQKGRKVELLISQIEWFALQKTINSKSALT